MGIFAGTQWDRPPQCERCGKLVSDCRCPPADATSRHLAPPQDQTATLTTENRKRGKAVTVVRGLLAEKNDLPALLTKLKTACGAGGTIKEDAIEIQGSHLDLIRRLLTEIGYKIKKSN
jgi:translation initiation factor 1